MSGEITTILRRLRNGDISAQSELANMVYCELRRIASGHMRREPIHHILQPSALVNEAFMRILQEEKGFENRAQLFGIASTMMRRILVDYARADNAVKRGGRKVKVDINHGGNQAAASERPIEMLLLDDALSRLAQADGRQAQIVEMRYFGGMSNEEIATVLGISVRTVAREWQSARSWLHAELSK